MQPKGRSPHRDEAALAGPGTPSAFLPSRLPPALSAPPLAVKPETLLPRMGSATQGRRAQRSAGPESPAGPWARSGSPKVCGSRVRREVSGQGGTERWHMPWLGQGQAGRGHPGHPRLGQEGTHRDEHDDRQGVVHGVPAHGPPRQTHHLPSTEPQGWAGAGGREEPPWPSPGPRGARMCCGAPHIRGGDGAQGTCSSVG